MLQRLGLAYRARRYKSHHDPREIAELMRQTPRGGVALDIGAHKGAYTYWLRKGVGGSGRVVSVEPQEELAATLARIYRGDPCVTVRHGAVAGATGAATLRIPGEGPSHGASIRTRAEGGSAPVREREVDACTLGDLVADEGLGRLDVIKCDCEGAELDIFRAGVGVLERFRPVVLVECERRHARGAAEDPVGELAGVFAGLGYEGLCVFDGAMVPIDAFGYDRHQRDPRDKRRYGNNFLFIPS